jgi:hypothetical protein
LQPPGRAADGIFTVHGHHLCSTQQSDAKIIGHAGREYLLCIVLGEKKGDGGVRWQPTFFSSSSVAFPTPSSSNVVWQVSITSSMMRRYTPPYVVSGVSLAVHLLDSDGGRAHDK